MLCRTTGRPEFFGSLSMWFGVTRVVAGRPVIRVLPHISQIVECAEGNHHDHDRGAEKHEGEQHVSLAT
jgi:hypothetical protein